MACLDESVIVEMLEGRLDEASLDGVAAHLDSCASCRALIGDAARGIDAAPAPLSRGASVGRYVVFGPIGSGSMGTVYAAYDPELDRKVALKLVRADALADKSAAERGPRLLYEAQALAKLSHPNVVNVHDVGKLGDSELFIAMEFVDGWTLTEWLHERKRSRRDIVRVFMQAGDGLDAAHGAGIVHRDFKPENVLIGRDGRVRVSDFGLARAPSREPERDDDGGGDIVSSPASLRATRTGALLGTPAYMAPEQWEGRPTDARTDVFGFSVALFEALYGARPYAANDAATTAQLMRAEEIVEPAGARVPAWLARVVRRGLRADPDARWPAMRPLLDALARGPLLTLGRVAAALGFLTLLALLVFVYPRWLARAGEPCRGADAAWGSVFSSDERAAARAAFLRSGRPSAAQAFLAVERALDDVRARWIAMRTEACIATRVRGEQSEALLDARMSCLDDRKQEAAALVRELAHADAPLVDRWSSALVGLDGLDLCANKKALAQATPRPRDPSARARVDELSTELAAASALAWTGKYARARDAATPIVTQAAALPYPPLLARALLLRGNAEHRLPAFDDARRDLHAAAASAIEAHDDAIAADAWTLLVRVDGEFGGHLHDAERWGRYAEAAIKRLGGDDEREATRLRALATRETGDDLPHPERIEMLRRARALYEHSREPLRTFYLSTVDEPLAALLFLAGRIDEALAAYHQNELVRTRLFGAEHPAVAVAIGNQADCLRVLGRLDEALAHWERAAAIMRRAGAFENWWHIGRAQVLRKRGDPAAALVDDTRAVKLAEASDGPDSKPTAEALDGEGLDLLALGRAGEAVAPLERALAVRAREAVRPFDLAETRFALARALAASGGDRVRSRALAEQARAAVVATAQRYGSYYAEQLREIEAWLLR